MNIFKGLSSVVVCMAVMAMWPSVGESGEAMVRIKGTECVVNQAGVPFSMLGSACHKACQAVNGTWSAASGQCTTRRAGVGPTSPNFNACKTACIQGGGVLAEGGADGVYKCFKRVGSNAPTEVLGTCQEDGTLKP